MGRRILVTALLALVAGFPAVAGSTSETVAADVAPVELGPGPLNAAARWQSPAAYEAATGNSIAAFSESPMLAAMVAAGTLPPVAERVSDEPLVVLPLERIGTFGGQLNVTMRQEDFWGPQSYMHLEPLLVKARPDLSSIWAQCSQNSWPPACRRSAMRRWHLRRRNGCACCTRAGCAVRSYTATSARPTL